MQKISSGTFAPALPAVEEGGECEFLPLGEARPDAELVVLSFPDRESAERTIALAFSAAGELLRYSDVRGDLGERQTGVQTSIVIDFAEDYGVATNRWPDRPGEGAYGVPAEFLDQASLGDPRRTIERVKERCAPARSAG